MAEHLLVDGLVGHVHNLTLDILFHQMAVLIGELYLSLCHVLHIAAGIDAEHLLAFLVGNPVVVHLMVVSEEDDVEARHLLGHSLRSVLLVFISLDTALQSGMEQSENQVGLLHILDILHPFLGAAGHLFKLHAFPYRLVQPVGNGGCQHTDDTDLHTVDVMRGVGLQSGIDALRIGLAILVFFLHDVRTQQRTAYLANPLVVHLMSGLDVVVAHRLCIVFHVVDHLCCQVHVLGHHVVRPVHTGLSLQYIAVVYQQQVVAVLLALLGDIGVGTGQCSVDGLVVHEVPRKEMSVHITCLNHF